MKKRRIILILALIALANTGCLIPKLKARNPSSTSTASSGITCDQLELYPTTSLITYFATLWSTIQACANQRYFIGGSGAFTVNATAFGITAGGARVADSFYSMIGPDDLLYIFPGAGNPNGVRTVNLSSGAVDTSSYAAVTGQFYSGVTAPNGKIYGIPYDGNVIPIIDPTTLTADVATLSGIGAAGPVKWQTGVLAPNGKIYAGPCGAGTTSVLIIDPATNTVDTTTMTGLVNTGYCHGVLAPSGKIYFMQGTVGQPVTTALEINPVTNTYIYAGSTINTVYANGAALGPDGKIYFSSWFVYSFDPATYTFSTFVNSSPTVSSSRIMFGPDGKLYGTDANVNTYYYRYDIATDTKTEIPLAGTIAAANPVLAKNQKMYFVTPWGGNLIEVDVGATGRVPANIVRAKVFQH